MEDWQTILGLIAGVVISMSFGYFVVAPRARVLICESLGLVKYTGKDGVSVFTMLGPDGDPVKVPIGVKEGEDGEKHVVMGIAPLFYTFASVITDQAATKVKMTLFNTKSQISKQLSKEALGQAMQEGGSLEAMLPFLPKKAQMAAALLRAVGVGNASSAQNRPEGAPRGGGKAL